MVLRRDPGVTEISESSDYEDAWREWASSGEAELWEATSGDGITT